MSVAWGITRPNRSLVRIRPPRAFAVTSHSSDPGARNVPSRTLPPDLRPAPARPAPAQAAPAQAAPAQAAAPDQAAAPALARPAEPAASPDLPGLRLITVPDAAPPYDCEAHGTACPVRRDPSGAASYGADPSGADPYGAEVAPRPAGPSGTAAWPAASRAESAAGAWPRQFAQVVVEILAGARSPRQILSCTTDHVREQIGLLTPLVAADQRPRIQRILTSRPTAHAVEMTVVVSFGPRSRALAVRCEQLPPQPAAPGRPARPARWLCTELEAG
jgi:hypothetical protein